MTKSCRWPVVLLLLMTVSCSPGVDDQGDGAANPGDQAREHEVDGEASVGDVLADIARMELSYEERLDYLHERAKEEGEVVFYGAQTLDIQEPWSEAFQAAFPEIEHSYVRLGADDLYERALAEQRAGRQIVDVLSVNSIVGAELWEHGVVAEHHGVPVPDGYLDEFVGSWSVASSIMPHVIAWNSDLVSEDDAPRQWDDFHDPQHSGCVVDAGGLNFAAGMVLERGTEGAADWFEDFLDNGGTVRRGHSDTARSLASGEVECAVYVYNQMVEPMIVNDGAPIDWHAADPTPASVTSIYIHQNSPRPHAAALLMHWLLGEDGAQIAADRGMPTLFPGTRQMFERLQHWNEPGSDLQRRLLLIGEEEATAVAEDAQELLDTHLIPNLAEN